MEELRDLMFELECTPNKINVECMSNIDISQNLDYCIDTLAAIKDIETQLRNEAKNRLIEGQSIKGYQLVKKGNPRKAKDINELFRVLSEHNIDNKMFISACSVSLSKLEDIYANINKSLAGLAIEEAKEAGVIIDEEHQHTTKKHFKEEFKALTEPLLEESKITTIVKKI